MALPDVLGAVRMRPEMYFPKPGFDVVAAFISGFNLASNGGLLVGFREWLIIRLGYGNNEPWDSLVLRLAFPDVELLDSCLTHDDNQRRAVEVLFELLDKFLHERNTPEGLRKIYMKYELWLKQQEWYGPSSPQWVE